MNPKTAKELIRVIPANINDYGDDAVAAGERLTQARIATEDLTLEFQALMAGGREASPHVIGGSVARPSDAHRAAIEEDHKLADEALLAGQDPASVGTPHEDEFRRRLASVKVRLESAKRAEIDLDRQLFYELRRNAGKAANAAKARIVKAGDEYRKEAEVLIARRRAFYRARGDLAFTTRLLDPDPLLPVVTGDDGSSGNIRMPGRYLSLSFAELVALIEADSQVPADVAQTAPKPAPANDDDENPHMRSFQAAGRTPAPSADTRFASDLPKSTARRLKADGSVR